MARRQERLWQEGNGGAPAADSPTARLIRRCLEGDEAAYGALYDQYAAMIYRLAYGLLQQREDAEEVLQDSFGYAFRKLARFDASKSSFKTWLYTITVSRCRNKRRRRFLPTIGLEESTLSSGPLSSERELDTLLELSERQRLVWQAVRELPPKLKETAVLRYFHGLSYPEIGQIVGVPPKTAQSRMRLAHKALRQSLLTIDKP